MTGSAPVSQSGATRSVRIFISTGEVSGDLQGALLVQALQRQAEKRGMRLEITALGGDRMAAAGATLLGNTAAIGSVGIVEALPFVLPTLLLQRQVQKSLQQHPPDLVVMIDYFGPNSRIGTYMRRHFPQVPLIYYIAPQEWVWSLSPTKTQQVIHLSDRLLAIFPEEARYYQKWGANAVYVGHPLVDRVAMFPSRAAARQQLGIPDDQVAIALLPASRRQEIKHLLPVLCQSAQQIQAQLPQAQVWIPLSLERFRVPIEQAVQRYGLRATIVTDQTQQVIAAADLALSKSGTANLEIALAGVPQVVIYRVSRITAWIARHVLKFAIPFMSPPNLVMMEPIVPELLQEAANPAAISQAGLALLLDPDRRRQTQQDYARLRQAMGTSGVCDRTADEILEVLELGVRE
ncbi:MAG: lipid-A-disaccharide synthase [Cyanobacteria bacterium J069]|nr:MAG: lipid-A-disaccharide synthase [Cyanobacteria bacterium J069]